jgi:hypothetical protein
MNFGLYMVGVLLVVVGLAYGASRIGISTTWITIICIVIIGLGVMAAVSRTRQKDPPAQ